MGLGLAAAWQPTHAQQSAFVAYAEPLRIEVATQALELRLQAAALASNEASTSAKSTAAEHAAPHPYEPLLALFAGSLGEADPQLLHDIEERLRVVDREAGAGDAKALHEAIRKTQLDLAQARTLLIPATLARQPDFHAAVIAKLAVSPLGFGEAYEDAVAGETHAYLLAWLTLQRVVALWTQLKPDLASTAVEVGPVLDRLADLMPSARKPAVLHDPEDAEGAALDLVFALERGMPRPLLVRGFAPQLKLARQQATQACAAAARGRARLALEHALAGRSTYAAELGPTVAVVAPDLAANMQQLWVQLAGTSSRTGADGKTCANMQQAMTRVATALRI